MAITIYTTDGRSQQIVEGSSVIAGSIPKTLDITTALPGATSPGTIVGNIPLKNLDFVTYQN